MAMTKDIVLYHFESCPFCVKVRTYMERAVINIATKDIREHPEFQMELLKIGGKSQVPCLVVKGKAIYESEDIIKWLKDNF